MAHSVQVANSLPVGVPGVELPDNITYPAGTHVTLTDEQFAQINPAMFTTANPSGQVLLIDGGVAGGAGDQVTTQGSAVTLTSAQVNAGTVTLAALAAAYNALQTDVAALNTAISGAGKALA